MYHLVKSIRCKQDGGHEDRVKQPEKRSSSPDLFQTLAQSDLSESVAGSKSEDSQLRSILKDIIESENKQKQTCLGY